MKKNQVSDQKPGKSVLGNRLKQWREYQNLTQDQVAEKMHEYKNGKSIYRLEAGIIKSFSNKVLEDYAQAIDLPLEVVLSGAPKMPKIRIEGNISQEGIVQLAFHTSKDSFADCPSDIVTSETIVALRVVDKSMEPRLCEGDVVFYASRDFGIEGGVIGSKREAIVMLEDNKILVRRVTKGSKPDLFHLAAIMGTNADPIMDVKIVWAARVRSITPAITPA